MTVSSKRFDEATGVGAGRPRRVRVAVVEQFTLVAETFEVVFRRLCEPLAVVVDEGSSRTTVATAVLSTRPDVALLHLDLVIADQDLPIEELSRAGVVTIVLTDHGDDARLGDFLRRGAEAALNSDVGLQRVVNVIARVAAREPAMPPDEVARLRAVKRSTSDPAGEAALHNLAQLSTREREILLVMMSGRSPSEIARLSFVSEATVRTQIRSIFKKLGVCSQLSAVALAMSAGCRPELSEHPFRVDSAG